MMQEPRIKSETLTDGSIVFNVVFQAQAIGDDGFDFYVDVVIDARDEHHAKLLLTMLEHTSPHVDFPIDVSVEEKIK